MNYDGIDQNAIELIAKSTILSYEKMLAATAKSSFFLCVLPECCIGSREEDVFINIPNNPAVLHVGKERSIVEKQLSKLGYFRWAAGGVGIKIVTSDDKSVLITVRKDKNAPSYAGHDTIGAGLSSNEKEWLYPLCTALREGMEEIIIKDKDKIIYPKFSDILYGMSYDIRCITQQNKAISNYRNILGSCELKGVSAKFIDFGDYKKRLTVRFRDQEEITPNILVNMDSGCGGIDVMTVIEINVESTLDELVLLDGEETNSIAFDRIINAWELDGNKPTGRIISSWKSGQKIKTQQPGSVVPHTKQLFEVLSKI